MSPPLTDDGLTPLCPICGAAVGQSIQCRHCGFHGQPQTLVVGGVAAQDILRELRDLGEAAGNVQILVLQPGDDCGVDINALDVFSGNVTFLGESRLPASRRYDLVLAGDALSRAQDVNRFMTGISASLSVRGLMVADVTGARFGKNSLQILLERHGFRLGQRPLKWRLLNCFRRRILARKL